MFVSKFLRKNREFFRILARYKNRNSGKSKMLINGLVFKSLK